MQIYSNCFLRNESIIFACFVCCRKPEYTEMDQKLIEKLLLLEKRMTEKDN